MLAKKPIICPVAFGKQGSKMLKVWLDHYNQSGSTLQVIAMTDDETLEADCDIMCIKHTEDFNHPQHRAGYLKMAAVKHIKPPVIAVDCDLIIKRPIDSILPYVQMFKMALGEDPNTRTYRDYPECGEELNSGLIWLNDKSLFDKYMQMWHRVKDYNLILKHAWADEIVCTALLRSLPEDDQTIYPKTYNYSRQWENRDQAVTVHYHGPIGKDMMQEDLAMMLAEEEPDEPAGDDLPNEIFGQRIRRLGDGTVAIARYNKEAVNWLSAKLTRVPNELRWYMYKGEWPSLEGLRSAFEGKTVYLIGKGPSLDEIKRSDIDPDATVVCLNESIHTITKLELSNEIIGAQYDGELGSRCYADCPMIVTDRCYGYYTGYEDIYPVRSHTVGGMCATLAINVAKQLGAKEFICLGFDAAVTKDCSYAESIGYQSDRVGDPTRFLNHRDRMIKAAGDIPIEFRMP